MGSIKYSEIFSADEVLSAGNDDIIIIAIVDGGSPTGFTTKAIKKSNLITDGDTLYLANSTIGAGRVATLTDTLTFTGGLTTLKGVDQQAANFSFKAENGDNSQNLSYNNAGVLVNSGTTISTEYLTTGVSSGFGTFQFKGNSGNIGRILPQNLNGSMTFTTLGDNPTMTIFDKTGAVQTLIGSGGNNGSYFKLRVAFGHTSPSKGIHSKNIDIKFEGATDPTLVTTSNSTDQFAIGSNPLANAKAAITNKEGVTHTLLVLNQAASAEFSIRESGVVFTNGKISIGDATPTSASTFITNQDVELPNTGWTYYGDPTTDGSWRQGPTGGTDFLTQRREATVWVTKQTITP